MTQQIKWYVGMPIIMTADPDKGRVFDLVNKKEYAGTVVKITDTEIGIALLGNNNIGGAVDDGVVVLWYFSLDGSCFAHPGMSIRLAKEVEENLPDWAKKAIEHGEKMPPGKCELIPTPSQWIEGVPIEEGNYWVWDAKHKEGRSIFVSKHMEGRWDNCITHHYPISELPPPPPVKEVEAFGYLEAVGKIEKEVQVYTNETTRMYEFWRRQDKARAFYSQPATAENKEKYLYIDPELYGEDYDSEDDKWENEPEITLDQFINWFKKDPLTKLLFRPAALEELGIK